jgi:hypothetical protein
VTHLDFRVDWSRREAEVERLLELGAVRRWDIIDQFQGMRWTTLADPEGNLFCIAEVKPANRHASSSSRRFRRERRGAKMFAIRSRGGYGRFGTAAVRDCRPNGNLRASNASSNLGAAG